MSPGSESAEGNWASADGETLAKQSAVGDGLAQLRKHMKARAAPGSHWAECAQSCPRARRFWLYGRMLRRWSASLPQLSQCGRLLPWSSAPCANRRAAASP